MTTALLWLLLAGLARLACLYGFTPREHPSVLLPLVPLLLLALPQGRLRPGPRVAVVLAALGTLGMLAFLLRAPAHAWNGPDLWPAVALGLASLGVVVASRLGPAEDGGPWALLWCAAWTALGAWNAFLPLLGASLAGLFSATGLWRADPADAVPSGLKWVPFRWPRFGVFLMAALLAKPVWDWGLSGPGWWSSAAFLFAASVHGLPLPILQRPIGRVGQPLLLMALILASGAYFPEPGGGWGLCAGGLSGAAWHRRPEGLSARTYALPVLFGTTVSFALHANLWIPGLAMLLGWRA